MTQQRPNETDEEYEKRKRRVKLTMMGGLANGGGSIIAAAAIYYQDNGGNFLYIPDGSGNLVLDNKGSLGPTYDGLLYSGRGIELGATNDVDIPIHHTLESEKLSTYNSTVYDAAVGTTTDDGGGLVTVDITTGASSRPWVKWDLLTSIVNGETYHIDMTITKNSGADFIVKDVYIDGGVSPEATPNETITTTHTLSFEVTATADFSATSGLSITFNTSAGATNFSITALSIKKITNPNSYLTYYDFTDGIVTLGNSVDGGSSKELCPDPYILTPSSWITNGVITEGLITLAINEYSLIPTTVENYSNLIFILEGEGAVSGRFSGTDTIDELGTLVTGVPLIVTPSGYDGTIDRIQIYGGSGGCTVTRISAYEVLTISTKYTINTKTVNNVITHTTPWSALDWSKINNNPNLVGKLAVETLGATKTIPELDMELDQGASADSYYMCSEKSGAYLVDSRVAYGAEIVTNGTFGTDTDWTKEAGWTISGGVASCNGTDAITLLQNSSIVDNKVYIVEYEVTSYTSGSVEVVLIGLANGTQRSAVGKYYEIIRASGGNPSTPIFFKSNVFIGSIDNVSVREATATEIANYASTVRTNADLQQKGIQTTAFVTDGAGVPTSYSSNLLQFNGDGRYVDTQSIPDVTKPLTIKIICTSPTSFPETRAMSGTDLDDVTNRVAIGFNSDKPQLYFGNISIQDLAKTAGTIHQLVLVWDLTTVYFYVDGVFVNSAVPTIINGAKSFLLGKLNETINAMILADPLALPEVIYRVQSASEVATEYTKAKAIYPTLP